MHNNNNINILASIVHARSITNSSSSSILARVCILLVSIHTRVYSTLEYAYENNITREYAYYELVLE